MFAALATWTVHAKGFLFDAPARGGNLLFFSYQSADFGDAIVATAVRAAAVVCQRVGYKHEMVKHGYTKYGLDGTHRIV